MLAVRVTYLPLILGTRGGAGSNPGVNRLCSVVEANRVMECLALILQMKLET